ncbi:MAG: sigma-54 dependent transcriptional regulator [bacterium]
MEPNLLIIEDNEDLGLSIAEVMRKKGFCVNTVFTGEEGSDFVKHNLVDLALLDIRLPGKDGLEILGELKEHDPDIIVIMMTAFAEIEPAIIAMKKGAFDYLVKPFELDELRIVVQKAMETQNLRREVARLRWQQRADPPGAEIFGSSIGIKGVREFINIVSQTPRTSVLIQGESGTGKELVANAIHYLSSRKDKPLIKINCGAIPENLLESEMFGHEKGAFTDASITKKGLFEMAHTGTFFLDEISCLEPSLQPKLLRILETQTFRRVGGTHDINVDVRVVAATNQNLQECVRAGTFRDDLYYRLKVMDVEIPPLRDRREDILPLAKIFLDQNNREFNKEIRGMTEDAEKVLIHYNWPGNVREVKNVIERAVILSRESFISAEHLPQELNDQSAKTPVKIGETLSSDMSLNEMEKRHILFVLNENNNNKSQTARILGISRSTLREKLRQYGIADEGD